jgi:hypothetical protein
MQRAGRDWIANEKDLSIKGKYIKIKKEKEKGGGGHRHATGVTHVPCTCGEKQHWEVKLIIYFLLRFNLYSKNGGSIN